MRTRTAVTVFAAALSVAATAQTARATPSPSDQPFLWARHYRGPGGGTDTGADVAFSPDGTTAFVTGTSYGGSTSDDYATVAYDLGTGEERWTARFDSAMSSDAARAVAVSPDGSRIFVTGTTRGGFATVAYDSGSGTELWRTAFPGGETARAIAVNPGGTMIYVVGGDTVDHTVAYAASTGAQLWAVSAQGFWQSSSAEAVAVSADGSRVYVAGWTYVSFFADGRLVAGFDAATGSQLWADGGEGSGEDAHAVAVSPDGSTVFATGYLVTTAYSSATGSLEWEAGSYIAPTRASVGVSPDGSRVYVSRGKGRAYQILCYAAADGALLWQTRYIGRGGGTATPTDLAVNPTGSRIYVTGALTSDAGPSAIVTVAFDAVTGDQAWVSASPRSSFGRRDSGAGVAVSGDGATVAVAGTHSATLPDPDYATVVYAS